MSPVICRLLALWLALVTGWAVAQAAAPAPTPARPVYAVMSLIGDRLDVVVLRQQAGTAAVREPVEIKEPHFDIAAIEAAAGGLLRANSKVDLAMLRGRGTALFSQQSTQFAERDGRIRIPDEVANAAAQQKATHLVLIGKLRAPADVRALARRGDSGSAMRVDLEGLGFFLDVPVGSVGARGALVPYAFLKVLVIDLASRTVVGRKDINAFSSVAVEAAGAEVAWQSMSPAQKIRAIEFLVRDEVGTAVQGIFELLAPG